MHAQPKTSLISYFSNMVKQTGGINLAQGLPGFRPPEMLLQCLIEASTTNVHQYAPGLGIEILRKQAAEFCHSDVISASNIMITNGGTEAISLIYTYLYKKLNHRLNVMTFAPVYESYRELPKIFDNSFSIFRYDNDYNFELPSFFEQLKRRKINLVFLATPGNPLGRVFSENELNEICTFCNKNQIYLVIDLVYKYLFYNDKPYLPYQALSEYVIFADSFSKQFSITGWRLGYVIAPAQIISEMAMVHDYTGLSSPMPLQSALGKYLSNSNDAMQYLNEIRTKVSSNFTGAYARLNSAGFKCAPAQGGIFLCAMLPNYFTDGFDFACELYQNTKVAVVPGIHFDENWKNYIRLNIAHPSVILDEALQQLIRFSSR